MQWLTKFQFGADARKMMYQSFLDYLKQGVPMNDIVVNLAASIRKAKARKFMYQVAILEDISLQVSTGVTFSDAIAKWVPINEAMSIRAGMESGDPASGMQNTIDAVGSANEMKSTIFGKLAYPVVLLLALVGLILFFSINIIPRIAEVSPPESWPDNSKSMYSTAMFVKDQGAYVLALFVGIMFLVNASLPRLKGQLRSLLDIFPPYSFYKAFHSANMLISLSALMRSGIPFVDSMMQLQKYSSPFISDHLERMIANISDGKSLSESMDTGLLSQEMMVNVHMMSSNANFQEAVNEIGRQAVIKGIQKITLIAGALNGVAMLGVAGYVGWVYYCFNSVANSMGQATGTM